MREHVIRVQTEKQREFRVENYYRGQLDKASSSSSPCQDAAATNSKLIVIKELMDTATLYSRVIKVAQMSTERGGETERVKHEVVGLG